MTRSSVNRRLASLLTVLALVGAPALVLRLLCVGRSCNEKASAASVPFCPLPADVRAGIAAGFRSGRSPDVMATTAGVPVLEPPAAGGGVPWPPSATPDLRVPIAFLGRSVSQPSLPDGMGLDQIAPTIAQALGYVRSHPEVRAGKAVPLRGGGSTTPAGGSIPLVLEIAWRGIGTGDLGASWPARTAKMVRAEGAATTIGTTGSLPLDPAASLTTMGTGGLPYEHGITGSVIRGDRGPVAAWSPGAPLSVISTLGDDLRHSFGTRSRVGLVAPQRSDRGLVGSGWYLGAPAGDLILESGDPLTGVDLLLKRGYGADDGAPDVLGVVVRGPIATIDRETEAIVTTVLARVPSTLVVVAGTGSLHQAGAGAATPESSQQVVKEVNSAIGANVVDTSVAGGMFLDTKALNAANLTADAVVQQMRTITTARGTPLFSQVFPSFSVAFARYC